MDGCSHRREDPMATLAGDLWGSQTWATVLHPRTKGSIYGITGFESICELSDLSTVLIAGDAGYTSMLVPLTGTMFIQFTKASILHCVTEVFLNYCSPYKSQ